MPPTSRLTEDGCHRRADEAAEEAEAEEDERAEAITGR
jgi:hypothetical protein